MSGGRLLSLYINNRSGGLIYQRNLSPAAAKLRDNDQLTVASMLSSLALILQELAPTSGSRPMSSLEANGFVLCSYDVPTGLKLVMLAEPGTQGLELLLKAIHALYADYALKNPFYELDMPIKCDKFDERLTRLLHDFTR
ncbi:hypothetical protein KFE25_004644 [Diacronema lutheri]|uniref:Trafficking protein particle complex subunit n=2 Tax=Diacronema lutheri TaxID=2081491 RepID=A0A8J6CCN8_DIALT|nr:hypothetical protein KFE25_004644 [Diacronema lutheri]